MTKAPTVYDVAADAGVSIATVSRVLRRPEDVRASTRERVMDSVRDLGYVPSGSARGLAARRTGALGLYFPGFDAMDDMGELSDLLADASPSYSFVDDVGAAPESHQFNLYFDEVLRGAELEAWRRGFALTVAVGRGGLAADAARDMAGRVDGLLVLAQSVPDAALEQLARRIPIVVLASAAHSGAFDSVTVSNHEGMHALTAHVIDDLGIRDIAYVAGPLDSPDDNDRWAGFESALLERGMDPGRVRLRRGEFTRASGRLAGAYLLASDAMPKAVICANDQMGLGVLDALNEAGIRVPQEVVVTGFDGIEAANLSSPRLTTVHQPMELVGRAAIQLMQRRLDDPEAEPASIRLPVKVLLRESSEGS
ncbi:LacI family DNA-binding transcriptional regulator [Arthrobacter glacialis]|uniref:LacI family transcriptional regulator n=1 Tax=Arthrobacter glacialis TaxID=1664 RepID=A0A2S3ZU95_ARTGL|nr:LacI family DNA-binding transcriptional regulator [Arthrobacter glacialis]POH57859.1 LacI family transcriptional regulator [Arthrobacter glacialis]POH72659.1 LacI family transcriptional regulator [Arthrobacter glacialis]